MKGTIILDTIIAFIIKSFSTIQVLSETFCIGLAEPQISISQISTAIFHSFNQLTLCCLGTRHNKNIRLQLKKSFVSVRRIGDSTIIWTVEIKHRNARCQQLRPTPVDATQKRRLGSPRWPGCAGSSTTLLKRRRV